MAHFVTQSPIFAELPEILTPKDLIEYLPLGRDAVYDALRSQTIRNVRIGQKFIITKGALREFLGGDVERVVRQGPSLRRISHGSPKAS